MWDVTEVGRTNVIKQSCQFQNQKISSELSDDIDFFWDTIARGDGRVQSHNRRLGSCSPFIQLYMVMVFVDAFEKIVTQVTVNVY